MPPSTKELPPFKMYLDAPDKLVEKMYRAEGYQIVVDISRADGICFVGGDDVCPLLYHRPKHPMTEFNVDFDLKSLRAWQYAILNKKPMVGICRGAQFLNVMNGGLLYQHVDKHNLGLGTHMAVDIMDGQTYEVTSDHHQMMIPTEDADVILEAYIAGRRELDYQGQEDPWSKDPDVECCFYPDTKCLCYQPHPEWHEPKNEAREYFFLLHEMFVENLD